MKICHFPATKYKLSSFKDMKKRKNNIWLTIGVIVICVLLLYWLFARTLIVEDEELGTTDVPALIEQSPGE